MEKGLECQVAYRVQYAKLGCGELMRAVMAMRVSKTNHFALTVDHLIGCYDLKARSERSILGSAVLLFTTKNGVCAIGGWDGE